MNNSLQGEKPKVPTLDEIVTAFGEGIIKRQMTLQAKPNMTGGEALKMVIGDTEFLLFILDGLLAHLKDKQGPSLILPR